MSRTLLRFATVLVIIFGIQSGVLGLPPLPPQKAATAQPAPAGLPDGWLQPLRWRCIGPANMGGRITALSVFEADPCTYWVATATGGLLKTVNNGITFEFQFDHENTVSIGDVCVAPSDRNIVWVGTGENNPRNSVSYGDGVYKSIDGGKTGRNMGLQQSFQIGKILVHPKDPNIVYVGALGRLYGPNEERGLYKTSDGGQSWQRVLFVDNKTGVIDMRMDPNDPETLLVASYERLRDIYDVGDPVKKWGPGSGIHKTSDGGKSFRKLTAGLPTCSLGRIGLDYSHQHAGTVYAVIESEKIGTGPPRQPPAYLGVSGDDAENGGARLLRVIEDGPAARAGLKDEDVITSAGDKPVGTYDDLVQHTRGRKEGEKVKLRYTRGAQPAEAELTIAARPTGGGRGRASAGQAGGGPPGGEGGQRAFDPKRPYSASLGGQEQNAQSEQGPDGFQYGGVYKSTDGGETWARINSVNPRPMYFSQIRVDPSDDNYLYVLGVSLFRSVDGGKTFRSNVRGIHADQHALWIDPKDGRHMVVGCDGGFYASYDRMANWDHLNHLALGQFYHVALDTRPDYCVYGGLQDNGSWGGPSRLRGFAGPVNDDWINIGGGDGYVCAVDPHDADLVYCESQYGRMRRRHLRTGEQAAITPRPELGQRYRFNWKTPFLLSNHNSKIFYCAAQFVFRSLDRGNDLRVISPELTATSQGSATALTESPRNPNVLYAGTDDGALWVTRDGGQKWSNITANVGLPGPFCVASLEASRFAEGRAYAAFDGHRSDDDQPHVYVTEDFGQTWKSLRANLPMGSTRVLREDIQNPDLLYLGTEFAVCTSLNRGYSWLKLNNNLPTVAVHEFAQHPTTGELVAATHGRSFWILDVSPLRQLKPANLGSPQLFKPVTAYRWQTPPARGRTNRRFVGENPPSGAALYYALPQKADKVAVRVLDIDGAVVTQLNGPATPGLHRLTWDLTRGPARQGAGRGGRGDQAQAATSGGRQGPRAGGGARQGPVPAQTGGSPGQAAGGGFRGGAGPGGFAVRPPVAPGAYRVVLTVDGKEYATSIRVEADPNVPARIVAEEEDEESAVID